VASIAWQVKSIGDIRPLMPSEEIDTNDDSYPAGDAARVLELKKLALEIEDLERPWWKRPAYVLAALPTMLAFGTLLVGAFSGYFQAAYTKLENQRHDLETAVKEFEAQRKQLEGQVQELKERRQTLIDAAKKYAEQNPVPKTTPAAAKRTPKPVR